MIVTVTRLQLAPNHHVVRHSFRDFVPLCHCIALSFVAFAFCSTLSQLSHVFIITTPVASELLQL
jgi:hypothetical protein